ncbi:Crp/Fnr family transcriptional regulator [Flavobacterium reichenbachii]|uniref:Cyclic nucleotide-binding protein n=1 Tax=Flavobacterium reichenbachii TaxID=362418 RepID=A0A085ZFX6_9FLAO|nr:Crp/Fnr family transcriptional regulator [Flavobacterium reichenbachii]KFF03340.1 cyclic nucleotide-binding protein [Flavobacterium reichenbachii]OXB16706.1 cyclic nucleotide-binding protein [Flavobacterium reichenbachii]
MSVDQDRFLQDLKSKFNSYAPITEKSWKQIESIIEFQLLKKGETLLQNGEIAKSLHFIAEGILRTFIADDYGNFYNKNLFFEGSFAGSKISLLQQSPSNFSIEALEDCTLININYKKYTVLISENNDLKNFYISYLEKNWIIEKEQREISLVMENADQRYLNLLAKQPDILNRIPLVHIAAHLGITPTQLSRIRKNLAQKK